MSTSMKRAFIVGLALVVGMAALVWKSGFFMSFTTEEKALFVQGMALHSAIWDYEADHGQLPGQLTGLVPKYLKQTDLEAPKPHTGGYMFQMVPTAEMRMNDHLLISTPFTSAEREGTSVVYIEEDGDVGVLR